MALIQNRWLPLVSLILASILWSGSFIAMKAAIRSYHPLLVVFCRMFLASLCFLFFQRRFRGVVLQKGDWPKILLLVLFEPCLYFIFESMALSYTSASQAGMIVGLLPLMVAVAARSLLAEPLALRALVGFCLAIAGVGWLSAASVATEQAPNPILGNFLELMAMVCATGYTITLKRLSARIPPLFLTAAQALAGTVFFFPALFLPQVTWPVNIELGPTLAVLYLGILVTIGAYGLYNYGVSRIPAGQAAAFTNLIPVFTVFLGWLVLGETFTFPQYVASLLVFAGVFVSQKIGNGQGKKDIHPRV